LALGFLYLVFLQKAGEYANLIMAQSGSIARTCRSPHVNNRAPARVRDRSAYQNTKGGFAPPSIKVAFVGTLLTYALRTKKLVNMPRSDVFGFQFFVFGFPVRKLVNMRLQIDE